MTTHSLDILLSRFGTNLFHGTNQSVVPCSVVTVVSWPAYRFLRRQVRWSGIPISWRIFQFVVIYTVKGLGIINEEKVDVFLVFSCFFNDPTDIGNLISGSSAFSKSSLNIWRWKLTSLDSLKRVLGIWYWVSIWLPGPHFENCYFGIWFLHVHFVKSVG